MFTEITRDVIPFRLGALPIALTACLASIPQSFAQTDASSPSLLEEVVVTASRREMNLSEVPSSVTAIGEETLAAMNASRFDDFISQIPNLGFTGLGPGQRQIILRGLSTSVNEQAATTAMYIDEIPIGSSTAAGVGARTRPDINVFDLERVEVLRGPQGTLFGANALGGQVSYITKRPNAESNELSLRVEGTSVAHGGEGYGLDAAGNLVLSDSVAVRGSIFSRNEAGYIDDVGAGGEDVNELDTSGGRFDLQADPSEQLTIRASIMYQEMETGGNGVIDINNVTKEPIVGEYAQSRFVPESFEQEFFLYALTLDYDFGNAVLTSTTSYNTIEQELITDFTPFDSPFLPNNFPDLFPQGSLFPAFRDTTIDKFTQEFKLTSTSDGPLEYVLGLFYTEEDTRFIDDERGIPSVDQLGNAFDFPRAFFSDTDSVFEQYAAFANLTYSLSESFDLTGGLRYSRNDQDVTITRSNPFLPEISDSTTGDDSDVDYLLTARWRPTDDMMVYGRAASGFRPGGPNPLRPGAEELGAVAEYDSDSVWNYELGIKASTADGRYSVDATAFFIDWSDIQLRSAVFTSTGPSFFIFNGEDASSVGAELVFTANPFDGFTASLNFGYTDATLEDDVPSLGGSDGDVLPNVAEWTFGGVVNYSFSLSDGMQANIGGSWRSVDDRLEDFNTRGRDRLVADGYTIANLNAGVTFKNDLQLNLYVKNLTDERGEEAVVSNSAPSTLTLSRPRTYGVSITYSM